MTVSQESYFSSNSNSRRRREVACPEVTKQQFQNIFSNIPVVEAKRVGYFDIVLMDVTNSLDNVYSIIQSVVEPQLSMLVSANCYSQYWISEINQNYSLCACSSEATEEDSVYLCTEPACNCTGMQQILIAFLFKYYS